LFPLIITPLLNLLPEHTECHALETIGKYPSLESTSEQSHHSVSLYHVFDRIHLRQFLLVGLSGGLDDPDAVGTRVTYHTGCEPDPCIAGESLQEVLLLLRDVALQEVIGGEPWVMSDEVCSDCCQCPLPEDEDAVDFHLID